MRYHENREQGHIMKLQRILKAGAQAFILVMIAASSPQAQKPDETPRPARDKPARVAKSPGNGLTQPTPEGTAVARLRKVEGNVLVSGKSGLSSAEGPVPLQEGARVITTAESSAVVVFNDGCEVTLQANQRLEVESDRPCKERILLAQSIFLEQGSLVLGAAAGSAGAAGAGAAGAAGSATAAVLGGAVPGAGLAAGTGLAGLAALVDTRESSPASPN